MTPDTRLRLYKLLEDILKAAHRIEFVLYGVTQEEFCHRDNLDMQDIVARQFSIIGEAAAALVAKHLDACDNALATQLRQAKGMRNKIVHEYSSVNWQMVWQSAKQSLPPLIMAGSSTLERLREID